MSYDLDTKFANCDHRQTWERYVVDSFDLKTLHLAANPELNMRAPINGQAAVRIWISGALVSPNHPIFGYSIVPDTNRVETTDQFWKIMFNKQVRGYTPLIEVSYVTTQGFCLKCSGSGLAADLKKANSGSFLHVVGTEKLAQRVLKYTLTSRCPFYPSLTCRVKDMVGRKLGVGITDTDVSTEVVNSLTKLKTVQSAQRNVQNLDPSEMLRDVANVVTSNPDPTSLAVSASIIAYGIDSVIPVSFSLTSTRGLVGN